MFGWNLVTWLHLMSMAFFVGGQLFMAGVILPLMRDSDTSREKLRLAARRFGYGSAIAFVVLIITGSMMAGHYQLWDDPKLHFKLALVALTIAMIAWHMKKPTWHWLEGLVFVFSLVIVFLGIQLAH